MQQEKQWLYLLRTMLRAQIFQHPNVTGANPPSQRSPLKSEYKAMLKKKVIEVESLNSLTSDLKSNIVYKDRKISAQQERIKELASLLLNEKKKSPAVIEQLMEQADTVIAEASDIKLASNAMTGRAIRDVTILVCCTPFHCC
eukprot:scaffold12269_cov41-Cyclotella_meneghiniana.AAC.5